MDRDFMLEDVETLDFELDVAVKEVFPPLENLEVTPTKEEQTFNHESSYGYDEVVVKPIPDEYIIPEGLLPITENTTYDVRQYARVSASVHPAPVLQDKELTITENGTYVLRADEEYEGLNEVTVSTDAIEVLTEELETYNNELTEQETTINDIVQMLKDKGIGEAPKYAPNVISFYGNTTSNLEYELANLDISNLTTMAYMFYGNNKLKSIDLSNWDDDNITSLNSMFNSCRIIESINLSNFKGINVTSTAYMFTGCFALNYIDLRNFDFSKVTNYTVMFQNVPTDCEIIVKDDTAKAWITSKFTTLTNVKTVAEYEG